MWTQRGEFPGAGLTKNNVRSNAKKRGIGENNTEIIGLFLKT